MRRSLLSILTTAVLASAAALGAGPAEAAPAACPRYTPSDVDGGGPDVIVGLPSYDLPGKPDAGALAVFSNVAAVGSSTPRAPVRRTLVTADSIPGLTAQAGARFGSAVFVEPDLYEPDDGDLCADVVVGVPGQDVGAVRGAGRVVTLRGAPGGLAGVLGSWDEGSLGGTGGAQAGAGFGWSITGLSGGALLVAAPGRDLGSVADAGQLLWFSPAGSPNQTASVVQQHGSGDDAAEPGDRFGEVLKGVSTEVGLVVLVGLPHEDVGSKADAGAVEVVVASNRASLVSQDSAGAGGAAEAGDRYGASVDVYFTGTQADRRGHVVIGVPGEDAGDVPDTGLVSFASFAAPHGGFYSSVGGEPLTLSQNSPGVWGGREPDDQYGAAVLAGSFSSATPRGLVTASPTEDLGAAADGGVLDLINLREDGSADPGVPGQAWTQDSPGVGDQVENGDRFGTAISSVPLIGTASLPSVLVTVPGEDVGTTPDAGLAYLGAPPGAGSVLLTLPGPQAGAGLGMTPMQIAPDIIFSGAGG